jgi:hypothetical protein
MNINIKMDIKKLSNDNVFGAIKTNITDINELPSIVKKTYTTWKNKLDIGDDDIKWVGEDPHLIIDLINKSNLKPSSQRIHYEALANILLAIDKNRFKKFVKNLYTAGIVIQQNIPSGDNDMSESENKNYVSYDEICRVRDEIHSTISLKDNIIHLILSLNTYIPPIRLDYIGMKVVYKENAPELDEKSKTNYWWIDDKNQKMYIVLNHDKVGRAILPIEDFVSKHSHLVYINGRAISDVVKNSLELYPRDYLLCSPKDKDTPLGMPTYNSMIKQVLHIGAKQNIFRKAFINYWHDSNKRLTENELKNIAKYMRHSISTARSSYKKIIADAPYSPHEDPI